MSPDKSIILALLGLLLLMSFASAVHEHDSEAILAQTEEVVNNANDKFEIPSLRTLGKTDLGVQSNATSNATTESNASATTPACSVCAAASTPSESVSATTADNATANTTALTEANTTSNASTLAQMEITQAPANTTAATAPTANKTDSTAASGGSAGGSAAASSNASANASSGTNASSNASSNASCSFDVNKKADTPRTKFFLNTNQRLESGQSLISPNNNAELRLDKNCNLYLIYDNSLIHSWLNSEKTADGPCDLYVTKKGTVKMVSKNHKVMYVAKCERPAPDYYQVVLTDKGRLRVYAVKKVWTNEPNEEDF